MDRAGFDAVLHATTATSVNAAQTDIFVERQEAEVAAKPSTASAPDEVADLLWQGVRQVLLKLLKTPVSIQGATQRLQVHDTQVRDWFDRLVSEARAVKESRPVRYRLLI